MYGSSDISEAERLAGLVTCEAFGHHASAESFLEYPDGLIVARCIRCMHRMTMDRVPGGLSILRVQRLVEGVMGSEDLLYNISALNEVEDRIAEDRRKLDEAEALLHIARRMVNES